jgi:predicted nucleic acid-binding protein
VVKEAVNAVWRAVRTGALAEQESRGALGLLLRMVGRSLLEPELKYLERAFEISLARNVTVYGALYIALVLEKSLPLLTLGREQRRVTGALGVRVKP